MIVDTGSVSFIELNLKFFLFLFLSLSQTHDCTHIHNTEKLHLKSLKKCHIRNGSVHSQLKAKKQECLEAQGSRDQHYIHGHYNCAPTVQS